jgi:hypothetical protein
MNSVKLLVDERNSRNRGAALGVRTGRNRSKQINCYLSIPSHV